MSTTNPSTGAGARRRRFPWWLLGVGFAAAAFAEIWTIVAVGRAVGALWTIVLLIAAGVAGSWLVKREGAKAFGAFRDALEAGRMPHRELADGVLILTGGILMIAPGFLSDLLGVLLVLPLTRPLGRAALAGVFARRLQTAYDAPVPRRGGPADAAGDVVQGEVVDPPR